MGGTKGTNTTTQNTTTAPDPQALQAYRDVLNRAGGVASTPYQAYGGELVAPVNQQQNLGIAGVNQYANAAQPAIQYGLGQAINSSAPITAAQIQQYESPFTQDVVNATQNQFNSQNQQQQQGVLGNAIAQGALGGNRTAIAQSELANQQQLAQAPVIAGLENQGYTTGLQTALSQQQAGMQGAGLIGNLGQAGQTAGLSGASSQIGAGGLQQSTQQALDAALYGQYQQAQAFPYQQAQWLAGIDTGVGSQMGGTSAGQTTAPAPSALGQIAGGLTSGVGLLGATGAFGGAGWLAPLMLSDIRAKENIKSIGKLHDGQIIYRFNYKGDPQTHIGLLAQNVEKKHPEAVHHVNGWKHVDYDEATKDAIKRATGGVVGYATGGAPQGVAPTPWAGGVPTSWIPQFNIAHGSGAPPQKAPAPYQVPQNPLSKQASDLGSLAKTIKDSVSGSNPLAAGVAIPGDVGPSSAGGPQGPTPLVMPSGALAYNAGDAVYARGGAVRFASGGVAEFADGGAPEDDPFGDDNRGIAYDLLRKGQGIKAPDTIPGGEPAPKDDVINPTEPYRMPDAPAVKRWRQEEDTPNDALIADSSPETGTPFRSRGVMPEKALSFAGDSGNDALPSEVSLGYSESNRAQGVVPASKPGINWGSDSKLWPSLISAGAGMLASRSPFLGNAIGEGLQAGAGSYNLQSKQELEAQQHAEQLALEHERLNKPYEQMTKDQEARLKTSAINQAIILDAKGKAIINPAYKALQEFETGLREDRVKPGVIGYDQNTGLPIQGFLDMTNKKAYNMNGELVTPEPKPLPPINPNDGTPIPQNAKPIGGPQPNGVPKQGQGVLEANAQMVGSGTYNYAKEAPYIEKGMEVPEPDSVNNRSVQALKTDAENYLQTGKLPVVSRGASPVAVMQQNYRNAVQNYANALAASRGTKPEELVDAWRSAPGMTRFILGADGRATVSLGTAVRHLETLTGLINAFQSSDIPRVRQLQSTISREFGETAATNIDAASSIIGPEIVKAIGVAGAGTKDDREHATNLFKSGRAQSLEAIKTVERLLSGQLEGKQRQAEASGVPLQKFKSLIGERPYQILSEIDKEAKGGSTQKSLSPTDQQALDWAKSNPSDPRSEAIRKRLGVP